MIRTSYPSPGLGLLKRHQPLLRRACAPRLEVATGRARTRREKLLSSGAAVDNAFRAELNVLAGAINGDLARADPGLSAPSAVAGELRRQEVVPQGTRDDRRRGDGADPVRRIHHRRTPHPSIGSSARASPARASAQISEGARRQRNDPGQYDDLVGEWWRSDGAFAALHWLAATRARLIPTPDREGAILLDLGCGGGLLAPHVCGYRHVGVDLVRSAVVIAAAHGLIPVRADVHRLPFTDGCADVVVAGEIFEHVDRLENVISEIARVLRPGGLLVFDTVSETWWSRFSLVTIAERLPGGPPPGCHDPALFVAPSRLKALCEGNGMNIRLWGLRPSVLDYIRFLVSRNRPVRLLPTRSLTALYQGVGRKGAS